MSKRQITLTDDAQIEAFGALEEAIAADTDRLYLPASEVVHGAALAYLGQDGWDDVGRDTGRGGPPLTADLEGEGEVD